MVHQGAAEGAELVTGRCADTEISIVCSSS